MGSVRKRELLADKKIYPMPEDDDALLTEHDVARVLGYSSAFVLGLRAKGAGAACSRIGRSYFYKVRDLKEWLASNVPQALQARSRVIRLMNKDAAASPPPKLMQTWEPPPVEADVPLLENDEKVKRISSFLAAFRVGESAAFQQRDAFEAFKGMVRCGRGENRNCMVGKYQQEGDKWVYRIWRVK